MYFLIGADLVPTESNRLLFEAGDIKELLGEELTAYLNKAEYRIFNLETPLTEQESPLPKCGPNLSAPTKTVNAMKKMHINAFTLANNHVFDHGAEGMFSTCKTLRNNGINYFGVGRNVKEASGFHYVDFAGKKIGVYACCEKEFGLADEHTPGANPFDPLESLDQITELKNKCDYVIVLYHGGKEYFRYPSPLLQKRCRKIVEKGADLVVCQHSHCVGCEEKCGNGTIVYGQGNFLFDHGNDEYWKTGLLIEVDDEFKVSYTPIQKHENVVRLAKDADAEKILNGFFTRSEEIKQEDFVKKNYEAFSASLLERYLYAFSGMRRTLFYRVFDKLSGHRITPWLLKKKFTPEKKLALQNFIECEAHNEALLCGLKQQVESKKQI